MKPEEIKDFRKSKKMSQETLGDLCGVTKATVSKWEKGVNAPSGAALIQLERVVKGEVIPIQLSDLEEKLLDENVKYGGFKTREDYLTASLKHLIQYGEFGVTERVEKQEEAPNITPITSAAEEDFVFVPFTGATAAGEPVEAPREGEFVQVPAKYNTPHHFVGEVNGRSMEPTLEDGARYVYETKDKFSPAHDKICVVSNAYGCSIKRYNKNKKAYVSDNPEFGDLEPVGDVKLIGYYVETL